MHVAKTIDQVKEYVAQARREGRTVGLVPTMGALHAGHVSLIEAAAAACDFVVVSIFVNPTQFGPGEDFERYPRPIEKDLAICEQHGVDVVFAPSAGEMYPQPQTTWVNVEKLTEPLCGRSRPGHFRGVTTVCAKLFNVVPCDMAFFGQKDAQQATVIRRMVADLNMPLKIVVCPTVREPDGLAMSSRNQYLSPQHRKDATIIYKAILKGQEMILAGATDPSQVIDQMQTLLAQVPALKSEYVSIVDAETLEQIDPLRGRVLIAVAARIGSTRLIDNAVVDTRISQGIIPSCS
jgi:pantoate--beta-alanine ligase